MREPRSVFTAAPGRELTARYLGLRFAEGRSPSSRTAVRPMTSLTDEFRSILEAAAGIRAAVETADAEVREEVSRALTRILDAHRAVVGRNASPASAEGVDGQAARLRDLYLVSQPDFERSTGAFLRQALQALVAALEAETGAFVLLDDAGQVEGVVGFASDGRAVDDEKVLGLSATVLRRVRATRNSVALADAATSDGFAERHSIVSSGSRSVMCVPVLAGERVFGAVYLDRRSTRRPFERADLEVVSAFVRQTGAALQTYARLERLASEVGAVRALRAAAPRLIGQSRRLSHLLEQLAAVAETDATVLITGESGSGKELIARALHDRSHRSEGPFVAVNCGAIPESLLESTLFGHKKGSFTGAVTSERGLIAAAEGGTLFLDEIGDMPPLLQVKILRVLESGTYVRLGDAEERRSKVRWVAATHRDLQAAVAAGTFREDLFYRLAVFDLHVPPLRERIEDISLIADHLVRRYGAQYDRPARRLSADALVILEAHAWPGNVRELDNVIQRAVILADSPVVLPRHLPAAITGAVNGDDDSATDYHSAVRAFKRRVLQRALDEHGGSRTEAAEALGLNRTYLSRLLSQLDLRDGE